MANKKMFITGNEAAVMGAIDAGAKIMFGYPITPATEILQGWISKSDQEKSGLQYLQTEDEIAAGFGVIGATLGGVKSFTASAGPGHILLQDPIAMAENLRLPFVGIMMQRGGPSTGTVNYSQQEVNMAAFGGNGDGLRVVYSASSVEEMYTLTIKAFDTAWRYRFPTFLLGDGYLGKMTATIELGKAIKPIEAELLLKEESKATYLRNCYSSEESFGKVLKEQVKDWEKNRDKIAESEKYHTDGAETIIIAHGLVASACRDAIDILRKNKVKIGLFRPITLNPFPTKDWLEVLGKAKRVFLVESSRNQFSHIVKYESYGAKTPIHEISKPAEGFTAEEIIEAIKKVS